ncbi:hypothetical protein [Xanthomonas graminis]|uniref:hypothetical protein n=1 Tax=Xanthomonas graminis TaxID=3390026 RepID=UPI001C8F6895|nr:hypothetical protein [Xanthomonas translucens]
MARRRLPDLGLYRCVGQHKGGSGDCEKQGIAHCRAPVDDEDGISSGSDAWKTRCVRWQTWQRMRRRGDTVICNAGAAAAPRQGRALPSAGSGIR